MKNNRFCPRGRKSVYIIVRFPLLDAVVAFMKAVGIETFVARTSCLPFLAFIQVI